MNKDEIIALYDEEYASIYDESFLLGDGFVECTDFEKTVIQKLSKNKSSWLDVACGTGYFLRQFSSFERMGIDISPAMLQQARTQNPDVKFIEWDFRHPNKAWERKWDLVTCMWYAYCYVQNTYEIVDLVRNLASWTSPAGACFVPVCDPDVLCKTTIPYQPPADSDDGSLKITSVIWEWTDLPSGKSHKNLLAPHLAFLENTFSRYFEEVKIFRYPKFDQDCMDSRKGLIAFKPIL